MEIWYKADCKIKASLARCRRDMYQLEGLVLGKELRYPLRVNHALHLPKIWWAPDLACQVFSSCGRAGGVCSEDIDINSTISYCTSRGRAHSA